MLTPREREDIRELLTVAANHIRELSDDALHIRISRDHRRKLESLADRATELREKI